MSREALGAVSIGIIALMGFGAFQSQKSVPQSARASAALGSSISSQAATKSGQGQGTLTFYGDRAAASPAPQLVSLQAPRSDSLPTAPNASASPPAVDTRPQHTVRAKRVNLRKSPNMAAASGALIKRGEAIREVSRAGSWIELERTDGARGWARLTAVEGLPGAASATRSMADPDAIEIEVPSVDKAPAALAAAALIVQQSRASYSGACGCPDDRDRAGRRCGGRSAYSRAGGRSLFCYAEDVPAALVAKRMAQR